MRSKRIFFVAVLALLATASVVAHAGSLDRLAIVGYQVTDRAVLVTVHNPGDEAKQGVVSVRIRLGGRSYAATTAVTVPAGATIPVAFEIPREWAASRLN